MNNSIVTKFIIWIMVSTVLLVGGAVVLYSVNASDMYLSRQEEEILSAYNEINGAESLEDESVRAIIEKYENSDFRILIADEEFNEVYSTLRSGRSLYIISNINKNSHEYSFEPKTKITYNQKDKKAQKLRLRAKIHIGGEMHYLYIDEVLTTVEKSFSYVNNFLVLIVILALLVDAVVVSILSSRISRPIKRLSLAAENFKNGDFSARYEGKIPKNEVGLLAVSFNSMADKLQDSITSISNYNFLLKEDVKRLSEYEEMRKKVVRDITHDLKTPLAIISSQIEMMSIAKTDKKVKEYYDSAMEEISKMSNEISEILNASHEPSQEQSLEEFDLSAFVLEFCEEIKAYVKAKSISFKTNIRREIVVLANKNHAKRVLNNYLINAASHVREGGMIKVSLKEEQGGALLLVYNEGDNVPNDELDIIWNNFERGKNAKIDSSRTGIGLYIVKEIANIHGDECGVINEEQGVTFKYKFKN